MVIVPSIDLRHGKVVRLQQGDYARQLDYDLDPVAVAESFAAAGAVWMHVVDLDGAKTGGTRQLDLLARLIKVPGLAVQVGGGVRGEADIDRLLDLGAGRVVVGTAAMKDWPWFEALVPRYAGRITLALDAKDGIVATHGWTETSGRAAVDIARLVTDWPLAGILYTDVAKDGMLAGPNFEHTEALARATAVPVIASGGVGTLDHIQKLATLPVWGVILGRSLHEGKVDLAEAIKESQKSEAKSRK